MIIGRRLKLKMKDAMPTTWEILGSVPRTAKIMTSKTRDNIILQKYTESKDQ